MAHKRYNGRRIEIYTYSEQERQKYVDLAQEAGVPLGKFLHSVIDESLSNEEEVPRIALNEELKTLRNENKELKEKDRIKSLLLEKYEQEIRQLQGAAFLEPKGEAALDPALLETLRNSKKPLHDYKLLELLGIDLADRESVRAITKQLEFLERTGFIKKGGTGWKWL